MKHEKKLEPPVLYIEGNVGVGKSTFLHYLHEMLGVHVTYEPNELWQDIGGHDLLGRFFKDQKRWAYTLQSYVLFTRIDQMIGLDTAEYHDVSVVERSVYSGRYCFAQVAKDIGVMDDLEWALYKKIWDREIVKLRRPPGGFIYLRASAQACYDRIMHRGRSEEQPITLDYLQRLEEKHEAWFVKKVDVDQQIAKVPTLVIDYSQDVITDIKLRKHDVTLIETFIKEITKSH